MTDRIPMKDAVKKLDMQLECTICLDTFKQPKLLPCFHVFCKSPCLEKLVAKDGHSLTCPTCRHIVPLSEKGVAGLQSDFHIDRLFEIRDAFNKAAEPTEIQCGSCENERATGYCRDCSDFVCDECEAAHKRVKVSKHHLIITLREVQTQATTLLLTKKVFSNCSKHPGNSLKIYCETCSVLICSDCTIRLHRDHNYDLAADVFHKHKEQLVSSLAPIKQKLDTVQQALQAFDARAKEVNDQQATLEAQIHQEIDRLHQLLDQRRAQLVSELGILCQQKLKSLSAQRDQVEITQVKLSSCLEYAEGGLQTGTEGEILAMKASVLKRIEQLTAEFDSDATQLEVRADLVLATDRIEQIEQAYQKFLNIRAIAPLCIGNSHVTGDDLKGSINTQEQRTVVFHARTEQNKQYEGKLDLKAELQHISSKERLQCEVVRQQTGQYEIKYQPVRKGKYKLYLIVDGNPAQGSPFPIRVTPTAQSFNQPGRVLHGISNARGTTINSRGQIVIVEGNGACVSVLTQEGEKIQSFEQLSGAYGVSVDKDDNIYVVENSKDRVQKFNPEGEFVAKTSSKLDFNYPVGIRYNYQDNNLYVADNCNHRIQVLSTDLKFVRSFGEKGSQSRQFQNPYDIAFDDANNLYVTEWGNHRVQVLTTEGQFLRAFQQKTNGQILHHPWAIAVDSSNTVYVSESHCVSVFTSQGTYITTFGSKGSDQGQFNNIYGLTVDHSDSVVIADCSNKRLQIY